MAELGRWQWALPHAVTNLFWGLGELVFPRVCLTCDSLLARDQRGVVCGLCWARIQDLPHPRCERCGHPLAHSVCGWCRFLDPPVVGARSVCWASDPIASRALHALKYHDWPVIAQHLAQRMARLHFPREVESHGLVFVPVPLSKKRLRERGYNQSLVLSRALGATDRGEVVDGVLLRSRETPTQTRLTPVQRLHNVAGAFRVDATRLSLCGDRVVVLVDDVITTGATLNACAQSLTEAGVRRICYLTFARARDPRDARTPPNQDITGLNTHGTQGWH